MNLLMFGFVSSAFLLLSLAAPLSAQILFQRTYGGVHDDYGQSVAQTADGGYVIAGYTGPYTGNVNVYLVKTDADGDTMWTRAYGGTDTDQGFSVRQTADSGYVIAGYTDSYGAGNWDIWLIRTDASGVALWTRTYGGTLNDYGRSVAQTADGGYVIAGYTNSFGAGSHDFWLIRTNSSGDTIWTQSYGGTGRDYGYSVVQTTDGGFVIAGHTESFGAGGYDVWLIKTDASGDTTWTRTYGGTGDDYGYSVRQTADGGYVVAGCTKSFGAGHWDVWLIKTDASGDTMWTRTHGGTRRDDGCSVAQTTDGGYVITGKTLSFGAGNYDVWLIKTDASGDTMWTQTFGGTNADGGNSVAQTADGGYAVAGCTKSYGAGNYDVWLIKTDSAGSVAIAEPESPVAHKPAQASIVRGVLLCPVWSATTPSLRNVSDIALHNCAGRKVMDLHPGPNDVRHLAPGVYFVRPAGDSPFRAKVILTR